MRTYSAPLTSTLARILGAVLLVLLALTACTTREERQLSALLDRADSLMRIRPDSSLYILNKVESPSTTSLSMRHALLRADAQNKLYIPFSSDSSMLEVVAYYKSQSPSNEYTRALYLLGCVYRDLDEAPHALDCWQEAVENTDTTCSDCDFGTLRAVYGQIAATYHSLNLPNKEIEAWSYYSQYALKDFDTLNYIRGYAEKVGAYYLLDDTAKVFEITDRAYHLYRQYGFPQEAVCVFPTAIQLRLNNGQWKEAQRMMHLFETESGWFDSQHEIKNGHEQYYYSQGLEQLGTGHFNSAEKLFRKLQDVGYQYEACKGLLELYQHKHVPDSAYKYANLLEQLMEAYVSETQTLEATRISSLHNYSRNQKIAMQMEQENSRLVIWLLSLSLLLVLLATLVFFLLGYIRKRQAAVRQMKEKLAKMTKGLQEVRRELELLYLMKSQLADSNSGLNDEILHLNEMIDHKEKEKNVLLGKVSSLQSKLEPSNLLAEKIEAPIVATFRRYATQVKEKPSEEEWRELCDLVDKTVPNFHAILSNNGELPSHHYRLCCLVRLGFDNTDIKVLISENLSNITMTYKNLHRKILQAPGSAKDFKNFIRRIGQEQLS